MRALLAVCFAFCSLGLSGCKAVYSVNSLNTSEDAVEEPTITGTWNSGKNSDAQLCIEKSDLNTYIMIATDSDTKSDDDRKPDSESRSDKAPNLVEVYQFTLVRLDDQLFADMVATGQALNGTKIEAPAGAVYHHMIVKLNLTGSELRYSLLDGDAFREANKQGYAPLSYVEIDDGILLTASTEDLRWSLSHYADRLFEDGGHYTRITDYDADGSSQLPCNATPSH